MHQLSFCKCLNPFSKLLYNFSKLQTWNNTPNTNKLANCPLKLSKGKYHQIILINEKMKNKTLSNLLQLLLGLIHNLNSWWAGETMKVENKYGVSIWLEENEREKAYFFHYFSFINPIKWVTIVAALMAFHLSLNPHAWLSCVTIEWL